MKLRLVLIVATMLLGGMLLSGVVLAEKKQCHSNCKGTNSSDTLIGDKSNNVIKALKGPDHVEGNRGRDGLYGNPGDDGVSGGPGVDYIEGGTGKDRLDGKRSGDHINGIDSFPHGSTARQKQRTVEVLIGGRGNDTIRARDGKKDIIRGGPGRDKAYVDPVDDVQAVEVERCSGCTTPPDNPPVANDDSYQLSSKNCNGSQAVPLTVDAPNGVLGNDTDADADRLKAVEVTPPTHGSFLTLNADGSFTYEAADGVCLDPDRFTYKANDGTADSNVATVTMNPPSPVQ